MRLECLSRPVGFYHETDYRRGDICRRRASFVLALARARRNLALRIVVVEQVVAEAVFDVVVDDEVEFFVRKAVVPSQCIINHIYQVFGFTCIIFVVDNHISIFGVN
jgi:hypothetical protein